MLTTRKIETMKPGPKAKEHADEHVRGLYLAVQPSGKKSWAVRYRAGGRSCKLTLGPYPVLGLKQARERATVALGQVAGGGDPAAERRLTRKHGALFGELGRVETIVESFIARHVRPNLSPRWARETERALRADALPAWHGRRLADIGRSDVVELLDRIADRGADVGANRTLATLKKLGSWSVERGLIAVNPFVAIKAPAAEESRDRVLDDDELRAIWLAAGGLGWLFGSIIKLLILTGQRRGEVAGMTWSELDLEKRVWMLPKERVKNNRGHVVPLPPLVVELLEKLPRIANDSDLVFTTNGRSPVSGFSAAKARLDELLPNTAPWRLHDLRRSFASGCAALGVGLPAIEKLLNHTSGSFRGVVGVYQRHDFASEKRAAMEAWATHVERVVDNNVVRLASRAQ